MIILNIYKVMSISQGFYRVCKNHNVILLILLTLLGKPATLFNLLKKSTTFKNFTWARAQVCHVHPTPMLTSIIINSLKLFIILSTFDP